MCHRGIFWHNFALPVFFLLFSNYALLNETQNSLNMMIDMFTLFFTVLRKMDVLLLIYHSSINGNMASPFFSITNYVLLNLLLLCIYYIFFCVGFTKWNCYILHFDKYCQVESSVLVSACQDIVVK